MFQWRYNYQNSSVHYTDTSYGCSVCSWFSANIEYHTIRVSKMVKNESTTFTKMGKLQPQHIYMLGLVPSDIVVLAVNITISVTILKGGLWMNDGICSLQAHVIACASFITTVIHTAMSMDRWVSIQFPHRYRHLLANQYKAQQLTIAIVVFLYICISLWIVLHTHFSFVGSRPFDPNLPCCKLFPQNPTIHSKPMYGTIFSVGVVVVVPLIVQAVTYLHILYKISKLRGTNRKRVCKSIKTISVTIGTFYVCMTPVNVWLAMSLFPGYSLAGMHILCNSTGSC